MKDESERYLAARLQEIAARYRRKKQPLLNIRLGELRRLFRHRLGLDASKEEIDGIVGRLGKLMGTAAQVGREISLTFVEKRDMGIRTIQCCDRTVAEVSAYYKAARQERQNRRRRELRRRAKAERYTSVEFHPRVLALIWSLSRTWKSVPTLAEDVASSEAFLDRRGHPLKADTLRQAVHRALNALCAFKNIEDRVEEGRSGIRMRLARLKDPGQNSRELGHVPVAVDSRDLLSPLQENGRTPEEELPETTEISLSDRDGEIAECPTNPVTEKRPRISLISAATDFPELPSLLDRRKVDGR